MNPVSALTPKLGIWRILIHITASSIADLIVKISDPRIIAHLQEAGLVQPEDRPEFKSLTGGVSSDIWMVRTKKNSFCLKQAREKLRVKKSWYAPVERNRYEVAWMQTAINIVSGICPRVLSHDPALGLFTMSYLEPDHYRNWKSMLMAGQSAENVAGSLGNALAKIHNSTAGQKDIKEQFRTDYIFHDIRLAPYLLACIDRHPDLEKPLRRLLEITASTKLALVHGDISPKNILVGPDNLPVILDAECAWYGDPAFDLAFCLKHFLLKTLWRPDDTALYSDCFLSFTDNYLKQISFEADQTINMRIARLLPGLLLGRIDGKSPIDYVNRESDKDRVRRVVRNLLLNPVSDTRNVLEIWLNSSVD